MKVAKNNNLGQFGVFIDKKIYTAEINILLGINLLIAFLVQ